MASDLAVRGFLCVLDGATKITDAGDDGAFRLVYILVYIDEKGEREIVESHDGYELHDLLKILQGPRFPADPPG